MVPNSLLWVAMCISCTDEPGCDGACAAATLPAVGAVEAEVDDTAADVCDVVVSAAVVAGPTRSLSFWYSSKNESHRHTPISCVVSRTNLLSSSGCFDKGCSVKPSTQLSICGRSLQYTRTDLDHQSAQAFRLQKAAARSIA